MSFNFRNKDQKIQQTPRYAPGKRQVSKVSWYILIGLLITPFVYLGYRIFTDTFIRFGSAYVEFDEKIVRATNDGFVKDVFIKNNDTVKKNQLIFELYNRNMENDLSYWENELDKLKTKRENLLKDPQIEYLKQMQKDAEIHLAKVTEYRNTQDDLKKKGLSTNWYTNEANKDFSDASQKLGEIERKIEEKILERNLFLETYIDKGIRNAENEIKKLHASLDYLKIRSPDDGTIAAIYVNEGDFIGKGQTIAQIVTKNNLRIVVYLKPRHFSEQIRKGQEVKIKLPDNSKVTGIVSENPIIAQNDPNGSSITKSEKKLIVVRVLPTQNISEFYKIHNLPVDVFF